MSRKKCPPSPPWNLHQEIHQPLPDLTGSKRGRRSTRSGHQEKLQHSSVLAKELLDLAIMMRNGKERMTVVPQLFFQHLLSFFQNSDVYIFGTVPLLSFAHTAPPRNRVGSQRLLSTMAVHGRIHQLQHVGSHEIASATNAVARQLCQFLFTTVRTFCCHGGNHLC